MSSIQADDAQKTCTCFTSNYSDSSTGHPIRYVICSFTQQLLAHPAVFQLSQPTDRSLNQTLTLNPSHVTVKQRTAAVAGVLDTLRTQGMFSGWRNELYPVTSAFDKPPLLLLERAAAPYFGIRAYGVHVNGYVQKADGSKLLWVARRSKRKPTWPGMLDHIVAGGQVSREGQHQLQCSALNVLTVSMTVSAVSLVECDRGCSAAANLQRQQQ